MGYNAGKGRDDRDDKHRDGSNYNDIPRMHREAVDMA
jgi:hypothetical protein